MLAVPSGGREGARKTCRSHPTPRGQESSGSPSHAPRRADAEQAPYGAQCVALVGRHLLRRQRIEVAGGEQRGERGDVEDRGADQRARGVEWVVVERLELAARAALLEERPTH